MADTFLNTPQMNSRPHPYLREPVLYLTDLPLDVQEADLAPVFMHCVPFRPQIIRDELGQNTGNATVAFKLLESAEKALATLQQRQLLADRPTVLLSLSPFPQSIPPIPIPPPQAQPRMIKHLPPHYTDIQLYDLFRPFGTLASVRTSTGYGPGTSIVEFCFEDEAAIAEEAMHCSDVEGQTISVQLFQPRRASGQHREFSPDAPAFIPSGMIHPGFSPQRMPVAQPYQPAPFVHGPGQQVQLAPLIGPGASHSGLIDPCNLFIKNLDADIDSNGLFSHFREFGQIVSARVMRNEQGQSRGFGFVSYQAPDQAARAMHSMNGVTLGNKQVIVRLHEPKQLRQEKLAQRFGGHNNHPRSASGATSPTLSEGNDSFTGWPSPGRAHPGLTTSSPPNERVRRSSGSYYHAALSGTLNLPMRYEELSALSPVVRKEVLSGELNRRIKDLEGVSVQEDELDGIIDSIVNLNLAEVVEVLGDQNRLVEQIKSQQQPAGNGNGSSSLHQTPDKSTSPSPAPSQDSRLLDPQALIATASAPEHPSTPVSFSGSLSDPPRTASPSTSIPVHSDRQRLLAEVVKLEPKMAEEITGLLMSLSKRERALCLFSADILKQKVAAAREIVALETEDDEPAAPPIPVTPIKKTRAVSADASPRNPDLSSRATSAVASPAPITPGQTKVESGHTVASLAQLPAEESVKVLASPAVLVALSIPAPDSLVTRSTDEFIDSLASQSKSQQKQALGEKLFKFVKAAGGAKNAGKITIALLDSEDLRSLAHLMNSYPIVLKEKIVVVSKTLPAK